MKVYKTSDKLYPLEIEGSWGQKLAISIWLLEIEAEWDAFIKDLQRVRTEILKGSEGVTDE